MTWPIRLQCSHGVSIPMAMACSGAYRDGDIAKVARCVGESLGYFFFQEQSG